MVLSVLLIIFGAALIICGMIIPIAAEKALEQLGSLTEGCESYTATVLDVVRENGSDKNSQKKSKTALITQFRIEEQKRTIIHRCAERVYNEYKRGDSVTLLFREEMPSDFAIVSGDNRYERFAANASKIRGVILAAGFVFLLAGIVLIML